MQRRATTLLTCAALAVALTGGLAGCTGTTDTGGDSGGAKAGSATTTANAAPPGKYRTLPEPCGAAGRDLLKQMLPGADETTAPADGGADGSPSSSPYDGEPTETYDTDRRVGCSWQSTTSLGSRTLTVEFERVVSYDPAISDDEQTEMLYDERATRAGVTASAQPPGEESPGEQSADADASSDQPGEGRSEDASDGSSQDELGSPSPTPSLPPRTLEGIGDAAFLDDQLAGSTSDPGTQRDIRLVFRTANVLVTVEYGQSIADAHRTPDSAELQEHAQNLARHLAGRLDDN